MVTKIQALDRKAAAIILQKNYLKYKTASDLRSSGQLSPTISQHAFSTTHCSNQTRPQHFLLNAIHKNNRTIELYNEFTDLLSDSARPFICIIKMDGEVIGRKNIEKIGHLLESRKAKILWSLNSNSDLVLGVKLSGNHALKHSMIANINNEFVSILESHDSWEEASLTLMLDWLQKNPDIVNNISRHVVSAGELTSETEKSEEGKAETGRARLIMDNASGHFQPSDRSLFKLNHFKTILLDSLNSVSDGTFSVIGRSYYISGAPA